MTFAEKKRTTLTAWKSGALRFDEAPPNDRLLNDAKILAEAFTLSPERAVQALQAKGNEISWSWKDMDAKAQQKSFTVAKAMTADILQMIRGKLQEAQKDGVPFEEFKKNLQPMLEESGWWGKKEVENPQTGKKETVQLGSAWQLETIYRTNLQTARSQGRYKQQKESASLLPFWEYVQIQRDGKRDEHAKLAGKIFPASDPIWQRIYPPRGFNCGCSVQARSAKWMQRNNRVVNNSQELKNWKPDEGWDFNPEEDWQPEVGKYDGDIGTELKKLLQRSKPLSSQKKQAPLQPIMDKRDKAIIETFLDGLQVGKPLQLLVENSPDTFGSTDGKGRIALSPKTITSLAEGLRQIEKKQPLTLEQEKAFATLQHELLHNEAKGVSLLKNEYAKGKIMEAVNELVSRYSYKNLIEKAGGVARFQEEIVKNGDGYVQEVRNLQRLIQHLGLTWNDIESDMKDALLSKPYTELQENLTMILADKSGRDKVKIKQVLAKIHRESFADFIKTMLP